MLPLAAVLLAALRPLHSAARLGAPLHAPATPFRGALPSRCRCDASSRDAKRLSTRAPTDAATVKQKHLLYDEVAVRARGGRGGDGMLITLPARGKGPMLSRTADGDLEMPPGGGRGGSVIIYVDTSVSDLLHLHGQSVLAAESGGASRGLEDLRRAQLAWRNEVDEDDGGGGGRAALRDGRDLRVPVPPGTFVRVAGGRALCDLVSPGQSITVAVGGEGGPCLPRDDAQEGGRSRGKKGGGRRRRRRQAADEPDGVIDANVDASSLLNEREMRRMVAGAEPETVNLELLLRTVADVGFVGFPNAGKSTLLSRLTRASPEVAPFPFTTLMPNLGAMADAEPDAEIDERARMPVLADLPGLVAGAADGKGLGRVFLRHLRRVRVVLYVVDAAHVELTPAEQYAALRRELRLYNADYLARPHLVALNKLDVPLERGGDEALESARAGAAREIRAIAIGDAAESAPPLAVVPLSALKGKGVRILREQLSAALRGLDDADT